ncbi:MAG: glycosyltransferase family 2 protein [Chloroflexi bacterium]|nr:glycosyltransferase family 2 protein [Chloroflexota bacterium]
MGPKVSVIIVNWNGRHFLRRCLLSLTNQTYPNVEIILVDNASTDGSAEEAEAAFPHVRFVRNASNLGFAAGCNAGIDAATGDLLATLNNDAEAAEDWVSWLVEAVASDPNVGMAASKMVFHQWPNIINSTGIVLDKAGIAWDRHGGRADDESEVEPIEIFGPCAGAALYKRELLEDVGLFDEDFFMYLEDVDLAWRARLRGWKCLYVPRARVLHLHSASSKEGSPFKNHLLGRNKVLTIIKNYPSPAIFVFLPVILFYDLASLPYSVLVRGNVSSLRGRIAGLMTLGSALRKRRQIQKTRTCSFKELAAVLEPLENPLAVLRRYRHLQALLNYR